MKRSGIEKSVSARSEEDWISVGVGLGIKIKILNKSDRY